MHRSARERRRWRRLTIAVIISTMVAIIVGCIALWTLPAVLTRSPSQGLTSAERLKATNDVRAPLVTFLVAIGAAVTVWFTANTYRLGRQGQLTDRFTHAVSQLGEPSVEVRVGGIYALERIADDSARDRVTIIFVLGALVRHRSRDLRPPGRVPAEDVATALRVLARLSSEEPEIRINLRDADLRCADLSEFLENRLILAGAVREGSLPPATHQLGERANRAK